MVVLINGGGTLCDGSCFATTVGTLCRGLIGFAMEYLILDKSK